MALDHRGTYGSPITAAALPAAWLDAMCLELVAQSFALGRRMSGDELLTLIRETSDATRILCTGYADLQAIDLKVIAEGVETPTQAQLLRLLRCDELQGYLLARPQSADDVGKLLGRQFEIPKPHKG